MNKLFQKIPVEIPKEPIPKEKLKFLLNNITDGWYVKKLGQSLLPLKKMRLSKKSQKEENEIKRILTEANQYYNDCNFQIHWNKLEWMNPRSRD